MLDQLPRDGASSAHNERALFMFERAQRPGIAARMGVDVVIAVAHHHRLGSCPSEATVFDTKRLLKVEEIGWK